jgi:vacuolar-type H+-ATPase catalytic subunit A/Vma1
MLRIMLKFSDKILDAVQKNVLVDDIISMKSREHLARMKTVPNKTFEKRFSEMEKELDKELDALIKGGGK